MINLFTIAFLICYVFQRTKIELKNSRWYCSDEATTGNTFDVRLASYSKVTNKQISRFKFKSLCKLNKAGLPEFTSRLSIKSTVVFPEFDDIPLDKPRAFLQTPANGECFFSSISWSLTGSLAAASKIRALVADYLEEHPILFTGHGGVIDEFPEYIKLLRKKTTFAAHVEIAAACRLFDINIAIYDADYTNGKQAWNVYAPEYGLGTRGSIYMQFIQDHYFVVVGLNSTAVDMPGM